jgi:hypothetical protein
MEVIIAWKVDAPRATGPSFSKFVVVFLQLHGSFHFVHANSLPYVPV